MTVTLYKDRVEFAMPARMMFAISVSNVFCFNDEEKGRAELERLRELLKIGCLEPLNGLPPRVRMVVAGIIDRLHKQIMDEYDQQRADKVATAIYYFLKEVIDSGYLELWEGTPVAEAVALYFPMIEHVFEMGALDEAAQKQGRRILRKMQERGYYI